MTRLRGLCIGAGYFSRFHFDAWQRLDQDVEIVGVCDLDGEKAMRLAGEFRIPNVFTDIRNALAELELDFVDIITRPDSHAELVSLAAERGLAILCQKPVAPTRAEARAVVETAQHAGVPLMIHDNFRFQPWYREIKRLIDRGVIGRTLHSVSMRTRLGDGWGPDAYLARQPYFREMPQLLLFETGVHFIDTFRFLAGEIDEVYAILRRLNSVIQGEDAGLLTFRFANGAIGVWDANRYNESTASDPRLTFGEMLVEGDAGSIRLADDGRLFLKPLGEPEREHQYVFEKRGFAGDCVHATLLHFVEQLRGGRPFETSGPDYLKTLDVQEAAYESARQNRPISLHRPPPASRPPRRIVDLSLTVNNELRGVTITTARTIAEQGWNATTLSLYSHCGTHMDAPRHFLESAATIDQQALDTCCGPARVLNLTPVAPRELLTVAHLKPWIHGIREGDRLLLRTDWSQRFGTDAYRDELPRISLELARWFVERRVALIGVEPPSVADVNNLPELTEVHQTLFRGGVVIVEGLAHLDQLQSDIVEFIALPLKVASGDGSPVRAIAIEEGR